MLREYIRKCDTVENIHKVIFVRDVITRKVPLLIRSPRLSLELNACPPNKIPVLRVIVFFPVLLLFFIFPTSISDFFSPCIYSLTASSFSALPNLCGKALERGLPLRRYKFVYISLMRFKTDF